MSLYQTLRRVVAFPLWLVWLPLFGLVLALGWIVATIEGNGDQT